MQILIVDYLSITTWELRIEMQYGCDTEKMPKRELLKFSHFKFH